MMTKSMEIRLIKYRSIVGWLLYLCESSIHVITSHEALPISQKGVKIYQMNIKLWSVLYKCERTKTHRLLGQQLGWF